MRKLIFAVCLVLFGFIYNSNASAFHKIPYQIPFTYTEPQYPYAVLDFVDFVQYIAGDGYEYVIYFAVPHDATTVGVIGSYCYHTTYPDNCYCPNPSRYVVYPNSSTLNKTRMTFRWEGSSFVQVGNSNYLRQYFNPNECPFEEYILTTRNLYAYSNYSFQNSNFANYCGIDQVAPGEVVVYANSVQLPIEVFPALTGAVTTSPDEGTYHIIGSEITLTPHPNTGYEFYRWEWNGGEYITTNNPETITLDEYTYVTAAFNRIIPTQILSPVSGELEVIGTSGSCAGDKWCFN